MNKFEVGKWYECYDSSFSPVKVLKRTPKFIHVINDDGIQWRMKVRDYDGVEYATDSSVPKSWRDTFTYKASWEVDYE